MNCHWNLGAFFKICFLFIIYQNGQFDPFVLLCNKSLNDLSPGKQWILFPSTSLQETLSFLGNNIHCSPRDQSLSVNCQLERVPHNNMSSPGKQLTLK